LVTVQTGTKFDNAYQKNTVRNALALASLGLMVLWFVLISFTMQDFQNAHSVDPLAMINTLFPSFWILLLLFASLCFLVFYFGINEKWLHLLLVNEVSIVLFVTPFLLSGFSWSPDSLWHGGIANYMPEILQGSHIPYGVYAQSYPLSYLLHYFWQQISGLNVFAYTLYAYPFLSSIAVASFGYIFVSRLLNPKIAFLSMLLGLSSFHFIEPHASPFSVGTILVLATLTVLTIEGKQAIFLLVFFISANVLAHPVSPLSLGIFFFSIIFIKLFFAQLLKNPNLPSLKGIFSRFSLSALLFLGVVWFAWTRFWSSQIYLSVGYSLRRFFTLSFLSELSSASQFTTGSEGFIYRNLYLLNQSVYVLFVILDVSFIALHLKSWFIKRKTNYVGLLGALFAFSSLVYAAYAYLLFMAGGTHHLLGRGLIFFTLAGSVCAAILLLGRLSKSRFWIGFKGFVLVSLVVFLFASFPIISYNKEAYNTFTPSQNTGLSFVATWIDVSRSSISISTDQQLVSYINLSRGINLLTYDPEQNARPDYVVLRINSYFAMAMRYDLSFEDNYFTRLRTSLENEAAYGRIYSDGTFDIYYNAGTQGR